MLQAGRSFYKLSGSGNDFVFVDTRSEPPGQLEEPAIIQAICARGTGVGADGIVFVQSADGAALRIRYLNSDGSSAALCGNATLCAARMAIELRVAPLNRDFSIETGSGIITARVHDGVPEIDLHPVSELQECFEGEFAAGELRIGFVRVGVPHVVVLCEDVASVPVFDRGRQLRHDARLRDGANVNFVSGTADRWRIRTYERGVEAETLACGTGAVATALMLALWGQSRETTELETKSGRVLHVRHRREDGRMYPSLSGEARIVFVGQLGEFSAAG